MLVGTNADAGPEEVGPGLEQAVPGGPRRPRRVGLTHGAAARLGQMSGGEQQQLAIGRALAGRPDLLILDEPTEGIQPNIVQQIEAALSTIRRDLGVGVLIVEQNLDFAWAFADHYFVMQRGRVVKRGRVADTPIADVGLLIQV